MFQRILENTGIDKPVTIHTLRHCFATHLMEDGVNAFPIKKLMGNVSIKSTSFYVHLTNLNTLNAESPIEKTEGLTNV